MSQWSISAEERREYFKKWRAAHPHYSRNWMRGKRGSHLRGTAENATNGWPGRKMILGVYVDVYILKKLRQRIMP